MTGDAGFGSIRRVRARFPNDGSARGLSEVSRPTSGRLISCRDYDLDATMSSGQLFRWESVGGGWEGVVGGRWVRLRGVAGGVWAETAVDPGDWGWLEGFLRTGEDLDSVVSTFPADEPMRGAVQACRGLRLVRQDPWECLASFILSSTKQIVQIRQVVAEFCARFGGEVEVPVGVKEWRSFPVAGRVAGLSEGELRACRMGFRAPYLLAAARAVVAGRPDLLRLREVGEEEARAQLMGLRGVGRKIADCVLLFAYGYPQAFPVDVWVARALRGLYFGGRRVPERRLRAFSRSYFGPHGGYAQQYLFHYARVHGGLGEAAGGSRRPRARGRRGHDAER